MTAGTVVDSRVLLGVSTDDPTWGRWPQAQLAASFLAGHAHADDRRAGGSRGTILPDFLIGAHAALTDRPLLNRDPRRIATYIPGATLVAPS